eukprot:gene13838-18559_t
MLVLSRFFRTGNNINILASSFPTSISNAVKKDSNNNSKLSLSTTTRKRKEYILQFDGGSRGNPGLGGSGAVIYSNSSKEGLKEEWYGFYFIGRTGITNNVAEYRGLIEGLKQSTRLRIKSLTIQGDSQLILNQLLGKYEVRSPMLKPLYAISQNLLNKIPTYQLSHIPRNQNQRADELANRAMSLMKSLSYSKNNTVEMMLNTNTGIFQRLTPLRMKAQLKKTEKNPFDNSNDNEVDNDEERLMEKRNLPLFYNELNQKKINKQATSKNVKDSLRSKNRKTIHYKISK